MLKERTKEMNPFILLILGLVIFATEVGASEEVVRNCNSTLDGRRGICISFDKKLRNCPPLLQLLREKNFTELQKAFCDDPGPSFELSWVKVCCPVDEIIEEHDENFDKHKNFKLLPTPETSFCGQSGNSDRIVGGTDAKPGVFPWMARIGVTREDDDLEEFTCGGSIISSRYILTAAHCFKDTGTKLSRIRVGDTSDDDETECIKFSETVSYCEKEENYEAEDLILHPGYSGSAGSQNDIALVRLSQDIRNISSAFIRPICLPFIKEFNIPPLQIPSGSGGGKNALVAGWGKLQNSDNEGSSTLQFLHVPIHFQCGKAFKANNISITEQQICAGGEKGKGSCAGDSGGPLTYLAKSRGESIIRNYQIGIVSFGKFQCAAGNAPVVYTRVKKYLSWILDNMEE